MGSDKPKIQTTTNLKNHLKAKHFNEFKKFLDNCDAAKEKKEKRIREEDCDSIPTSVKNKKQKTDMFQQTIPGYTETVKVWDINSSKGKQFHRDIFEFLVEDMHPWSTVQDRGFLRMFQKRQPNFEVATPKFYASLLDPAYYNIKSKLKDMIHEDKPETVAISLDAWSQFHNGYLGINCHYIDSSWKRKIYNLSCISFNQSHTSEHIILKVKEVLEDFNITDKVKFALRDNAQNMVSAFLGSGIKGIGCLSHSLQLCIKNEIFSMKSVATLLKKCKDVCSFANRSTNFYTEFKRQQFCQMGLGEAECLNLPHSDTDTRWNSSYYMVERFLKVKPAVASTLASKFGKDANVEFLSKDWHLMEQIQNLLAPFEKATRMLQLKDSNISCFVPIVTTIINELKDVKETDDGIKTMKKNLLENMNKRFGEIENQDNLVLATYLNPRYKHLFFRYSDTKPRVNKLLTEQIEARVNKVTEIDANNSEPSFNISENDCDNSLEKLMAKHTKSAFENYDDSENYDLKENIKDCLRKYEQSPRMPSCMSPLSYWSHKEKETIKPWIKAKALLAKYYLTAPPTSADVERLFSIASQPYS